MAGYLTTHVLDTALGCPAAGLNIMLYRVSGNSHKKIAEAVTNADGRTDAPILPEGAFKIGTYELVFCAGDYLRGLGGALPDPLFLDQVPIRFGMSEAIHYHVPLLLSPLWIFHVSGQLGISAQFTNTSRGPHALKIGQCPDFSNEAWISVAIPKKRRFG